MDAYVVLLLLEGGCVGARRVQQDRDDRGAEEQARELRRRVADSAAQLCRCSG